MRIWPRFIARNVRVTQDMGKPYSPCLDEPTAACPKLDHALADVFIFIGIWVNRIVLIGSCLEPPDTSIRITAYRSHQHRGGVE